MSDFNLKSIRVQEHTHAQLVDMKEFWRDVEMRKLYVPDVINELVQFGMRKHPVFSRILVQDTPKTKFTASE